MSASSSSLLFVLLVFLQQLLLRSYSRFFFGVHIFTVHSLKLFAPEPKQKSL
jgi:hypothetical protein